MAFIFPRAGILYRGFVDEYGDERKQSTGLKDTRANRKIAQRRADQIEQECAAIRSGEKKAIKPDVPFRTGAQMMLDALPKDYASRASLEGRLRLRVFPHIGDMMSRRIVPADLGRVLNAATMGALRPEDMRIFNSADLSPTRLLAAQKKALARLRPNAELPPQSREHLRVAIQKVFTHLITQEKLIDGENPAGELGKIRIPERKKKWLPWRLVPRLLAAVPEHHRPVFRFCIGTGLRKGEAFALLWSDLLIDGEELPHEWEELLEIDDLDGAEEMPAGGFVHVSKSHDRETPKGMKERVVAVPEWLADELRLARRFATSLFLFPDKDGHQQKRWVPLHDITRTALKAAGIVIGFDFRCVNRGKSMKACGFHEVRPQSSENRRCPKCAQLSLHIEPVPRPLTFRHLRSSYAMAMLRMGGSISGVAKALGNTEEVARDHYAGILPQDLLRQANKLRLGDGRNLGGADAKSRQIQMQGEKEVSGLN